jgi:hypothetical protein
MRELTVLETEQVSGGVWPAFCAGYFIGSIARKLYLKYV